MNSNFPCTNCGLCCQNISLVKELKEFDLGNGVCKYYDEVSKNCLIYNERPDICKVDKMYDLIYHKEFSRKKFYKLNAQVCNSLQEKYSISTIFRVKI